MTWFRLSLQEFRRRPFRTGITVFGVAISIAALFSLLSFQRGYRIGLSRELDRLGAQVLVVPKGCPYDAASIALHGASWPCYLKARYLDEVRATRGVATAAPALMSAFYDATGRQTVYVGIDRTMLALKRDWNVQGRFPEARGELLIGHDVAQRSGWKVRQTVTLPALSGMAGVISGILSTTGGADDTFIFMRLADAQSALHRPEELTHILVRLADPNELEQVVRELRGCDAGLYMNVVPLAHLFRTIQNLMSSTRLLLDGLGLVALLLAGAGVSNTLLMAVAERTREIGVLRALGASRAQIFRLFWLETMQVCLAGGFIGMAGAFAASRLIEAWLRNRLPFAPTEPLIRWEGGVAFLCLVCALALGCFAGFLPAWHASSLSPVTAMRRNGGQR